MAESVRDANITRQSASINADKLGINYDALPQMPFWGPLFFKTSDDLKTGVAVKIMASSASVGRELTQTEKDAMSYHFAKVIVTRAYVTPISIAATLGCESTTRSKFGFPFYNPNPQKFNFNKFPGVPEGIMSSWTWHGVRAIAWYAACKLAVGLVVTSYAISVYSANAGSDNRLESYRREIARRAGTVRGGPQPAMPQQSSGQPSQQYSQPRWEDTASVPESVGWAGSEQSETATSAPVPTQWAATQNPQTGRQNSDNQESYVFDDASPVAPLDQNNSSSRRSTQQSGSAWDRIRDQAQGARSQPGSWAKKRQDEMTARGVQEGTSYNYSSADEEKSYAKDQAQKEFDEMLERERRGQGR